MNSFIFYALLLALAGVFIGPLVGAILLILQKRSAGIICLLTGPACIALALLIGIASFFVEANHSQPAATVNFPATGSPDSASANNLDAPPLTALCTTGQLHVKNTLNAADRRGTVVDFLVTNIGQTPCSVVGEPRLSVNVGSETYVTDGPDDNTYKSLDVGQALSIKEAVNANAAAGTCPEVTHYELNFKNGLSLPSPAQDSLQYCGTTGPSLLSYSVSNRQISSTS